MTETGFLSYTDLLEPLIFGRGIMKPDYHDALALMFAYGINKFSYNKASIGSHV